MPISKIAETVNMLKSNEVLQRIHARLKKVLSNVEHLHVLEHQAIWRETGASGDRGFDLRLFVEGRPQLQSWELYVEVKNPGHPKQASAAVFQLNRTLELHGSSSSYGIFAAAYISPETAKICREANLGYIDLSGNCHLSFGSVHIHIEGKPNQYKPKRAHGSLFSPKASRVLRPLLHGPLRPWKVVELEAAAGVSLGTVSAVRGELLNQVWAEESELGLRIIKPDELLDAWAKQDNWKRRTTVREYSLLEHDQDKVADLLNKLFYNQEHAFTQWYASDLIRPYTITRITTLYVSAFPEEHVLNGELLARRVDGGGSLRLVVPKDAGVFLGKRHVNGIPVVSDIQLYLDLLHAGLRGDEAAEELRNWSEFSGGWHE